MYFIRKTENINQNRRQEKQEDNFRNITNDFTNIDTIMNCSSGVFHKVEELESGIDDIQAKNHVQSSPSFATVTVSNLRLHENARLDRVVYMTSEE